MKRTIIPITLGMLVLSGFWACRKNYSNTPTYTLESAMAELAVPSKIVTINAAAGGTFRGNSGTQYTFKPNSFVDSHGKPVTGNVQVEAKEFLTKADMLFSDVLPVAGGMPLISGGETYVNATQNGEALTLAPGVTYAVNIPQRKSADTAMKVFTGVQDPITKQVTWTLSPANAIEYKSNKAASVATDTLAVFPHDMRYINCDHFPNYTDRQNFTITAMLDETKLLEYGMKAYAIFDTDNAVMPLHTYGDTTYHVSSVPSIPAHFVAFGVIKGQFYGGIFPATPKTGENYNVVVSKTSPSAFKKLVAALQ